jgi:small-conductance mechanosensitive channel
METLLTWLADPYVQAGLLTILILVAAVGLHRLFHRRILPPSKSQAARRMRDRLVNLGIFLLALVGLMQIWHPHVPFLERVHQYFIATEGEATTVYGKILWSLVIAMALYLFGHALQHFLLRNVEDIDRRHKIRQAISRAGLVVFGVAMLALWAGLGSGISLGILGAGLALSLQESILCVAGWLLIMVQKPFDIGDRVEIDGHIGDVIDIRVFQTSLLEVGNWVEADQSTGRIINLPNSLMFRSVNSNYTKGFPFIWNELKTVVTFESDWQKAKDLIAGEAHEEAERIEEQVRRQITLMQSQYAIHYEHLKPIVYTDVVANGVRLTLRYLSPVRARRATTHRIWEGILASFNAEETIDFAYPTTRIFRNNEEGKPGAGGPERTGPPRERYYGGPTSAPPPESEER